MKRRFRRIAAALFVLVLTLSACISPAFAKVGKTYASRVEGLRIHEKANGGSAQIGRLTRGQKVVHLASSKGWWKIQTADGKKGYVYNSYLKPVEPTWVKNGYYKVYKITKATLRSGPRSEAAKSGELKRGTIVRLLSKQGNWGKVKASSGKSGWVQLKYLTPSKK